MPLMERREDRKPWGLILALIIAATAGVVSLPLQVLTYKGLSVATADDVRRSQELVEQVRLLEEQGNAEVDEHRERNEILHSCIVELALSLSDPTRDRTRPVPNPCPPPLVQVPRN